jgi:hypothetical protein
MSKNSSSAVIPAPYEPPKSVLPTPTSPMQQTEWEGHEATCQYGQHSPDTISSRNYHGPEGENDGDEPGE